MIFRFATLLAALLISQSALAQTNIALGRPVSASAATWSGQLPAILTDGNITNQPHPLANSGTLGFYYEIDLGNTRNLGSIELLIEAIAALRGSQTIVSKSAPTTMDPQATSIGLLTFALTVRIPGKEVSTPSRPRWISAMPWSAATFVSLT